MGSGKQGLEEGGRTAAPHGAAKGEPGRQLRAAKGRLTLCPTPLGNLGDMTERARRALQEADVVCAEDTRVTGRLLAALGIEKRLERLDEATMGTRAEGLVERVLAGEVVVYCSDAGMPGVSDPGMRLVRAARKAGVNVEVLPGPSAVATAYVASGCESPRFYFGGFFPRKAAERTQALTALSGLDAALIFYESPKRLVDALNVMAEVFPFRQVAVCRELTKLHEETVCGTAPEVRDEFARRAAEGNIKGEIVVVIDGPAEEEGQASREQAHGAAELRAVELCAQGATKKDIVRALTSEFGLPRNEAYAVALGTSEDA